MRDISARLILEAFRVRDEFSGDGFNELVSACYVIAGRGYTSASNIIDDDSRGFVGGIFSRFGNVSIVLPIVDRHYFVAVDWVSRKAMLFSVHRTGNACDGLISFPPFCGVSFVVARTGLGSLLGEYKKEVLGALNEFVVDCKSTASGKAFNFGKDDMFSIYAYALYLGYEYNPVRLGNGLSAVFAFEFSDYNYLEVARVYSYVDTNDIFSFLRFNILCEARRLGLSKRERLSKNSFVSFGASVDGEGGTVYSIYYAYFRDGRVKASGILDYTKVENVMGIFKDFVSSLGDSEDYYFVTSRQFANMYVLESVRICMNNVVFIEDFIDGDSFSEYAKARGYSSMLGALLQSGCNAAVKLGRVYKDLVLDTLK